MHLSMWVHGVWEICMCVHVCVHGMRVCVCVCVRVRLSFSLCVAVFHYHVLSACCLLRECEGGLG